MEKKMEHWQNRHGPTSAFYQLICIHSSEESIWTSWRCFIYMAFVAEETNEGVCGVTLTGLWITLPLDLIYRMVVHNI